MIKALGAAIRKAFEIIFTPLIEMGRSFVDDVISNLPPQVQLNIQLIGEYWNIGNAWLALDVAVGLLIAYVAFFTYFQLIKLLLKLIPTIG